ncbi:MAG: hypothetical protein U0359_24965 [Byssovorax sp.]
MRKASTIALLGPAALLLGLASPAQAEGTSLRATLVEPKSIKLDGIPKEWSALSAMPYASKGRAGKPDAEGKAAVAYDAANVYVTAELTDDTLRPGADHIELCLGFPGGTVYELSIFPGEPGKSPGSAKMKDGGAVAGAKVVEAPTSGGWSIEAAIPWSAFPAAKSVRVGLRGAIFFHDADSGSAIKNILGTAPSTAYASLPPISTEPEQALADGLVRDKSIKGAPRHNLLADVAGDAMKERVLVYDRYLVVLGSGFRKGAEYYYSDLGVDPAQGMLPSFEVRDLTGDGQSEILLRKRIGTPSRYREVLQVLHFGSGDVPVPIFQHEVGVTTDAGSIANEVSVIQSGAKASIKITPGASRGFSIDNYKEPTESSFDPVLLPWGAIASQTYTYSGSGFTKMGEEKQAPQEKSPDKGDAAQSLPKPPAPPSASELLEQVHAQYRRDRGVSGKARFDLAVDLTADKQAERVLLYDRDLVLFGKGYKGGTGYTFLTLTQFAAGADITDLGARDLTGDGKAELIVKGVMHAPAPKEIGGTVDREVLLVYQMNGESLKRIFAAETARSLGSKRVTGALRLLPDGIELGPGKAVEWTESTYPFGQDQANGGFEPLLLPWGGNKPIKYRWSGSSFSR